ERPAEEAARRGGIGQGDPARGRQPKLLSPQRRRQMVDHVVKHLRVSQRRACRVLGQSRMTQRYLPQVRDDETPLVRRIIELAGLYGGSRAPRDTALLRREGWTVNHKRVERIWRQAGLKVPQKQPKRGRLWLNTGSRVAEEAGGA